MIEFMRAGGFLMWPLLGVGLVAVVHATRGVLQPAGDTQRARRLARSVLAASIGWALMGWVVVSRHALEAPPAVLLVGLGEAACPAVLGLMIYALTHLISTVPAARALRG